jgi:hypothetical protein
VSPDKNEPQFVYVSKRLLDDLYKQHVSSKRGSRLDSVSVAGTGVSGRIKTAQPDNEYWLAREVTKIVQDNTGSLLYPGKYVKCELEMTRATIPFSEERTTVAWFEGERETEEGSIFVALCGSVQNLRGAAPPTELKGHWFPSSAEGLTQVVRAFGRGNNDPRQFLRAEPEELPGLFSFAYGKARSPTATYRIETRRLEMVFEVFYELDHAKVPKAPDSYLRHAYFGTPLWAAIPAPKPLHSPGKQETATSFPAPERPRWRLGKRR